MIVTVEPLTLTLPRSLTPRSKGIHVSRVIKSMAGLSGVLKAEYLEEDMSLIEPEGVSSITDSDAILRVSIGLAWEEWYIRTQLPHLKDHPGELFLDDVWMSPDATEVTTFHKDEVVKAIHEVKATYKSVKSVGTLKTEDELKKNWMWLAQLKSYCLAAETCLGYLHVLFIAGNYKPAFKPQLRKFKITFTEAELVEHWELTQDYILYKLEEEESK